MKLDFVYDTIENKDEIVRTVSAMLIKHFKPNNYFIVSSNFASYNGASLRVELDPQALIEDLMVAKLKFEKSKSNGRFHFRHSNPLIFCSQNFC